MHTKLLCQHNSGLVHPACDVQGLAKARDGAAGGRHQVAVGGARHDQVM